jgi:cyclase
MAAAAQVHDRVLVISGDCFEEHMTVVRTGRGLVVIDTLATASATRRALGQVAAFSNEPVRYLINTHFDIDHYAGNELFPEAVIIGHANCPKHYGYQLFDNPANAGDIQGLIDKLESESLNSTDTEESDRKRFYISQYRNLLEGFSAFRFTPPQLFLAGCCTLRLGEVTLEILYAGPGHTDADLIIHIPAMKLLMTGDLVLGPSYLPIIHGLHNGSATNLTRILERIAGMQPHWEQLIPGHGSLCGIAAVHDQLDYLNEMGRGVRLALQSNLTLEQSRPELQLDRFRHHWFYEFAHAGNLDVAWKETANLSA